MPVSFEFPGSARNAKNNPLLILSRRSVIWMSPAPGQVQKIAHVRHLCVVRYGPRNQLRILTATHTHTGRTTTKLIDALTDSCRTG
eukprot:3075535-Pyramimonas_sp.AAC.1